MHLEFAIGALLKMLVLVSFVLVVAGLLSWVERRQSAFIQDRIGPNRASIFGVRAWGLFHILADTLKLALKEKIVPRGANKVLFWITPFAALATSLAVFAVVPVGPWTDSMLVSNVDVGILFIFAMASLSVYGATLGGWASNNNFSLLGALRVSAQMISYEVTLGLTLVGVFMVYESIHLQDIVFEQGELLWGWLPKWGIVVQPVGFFLFLTAAIAETKRAPFDAPEGDSEIVSGYFTEYSGLGFAGWFTAEFAAVILVAMLLTTLFFGGWQIPFVDPAPYLNKGWFVALCVLSFVGKTFFFIWVQMQLRWTLPRFRYDQTMRVGWQYLLPLSLANIVVTGLILLIQQR